MCKYYLFAAFDNTESDGHLEVSFETFFFFWFYLSIHNYIIYSCSASQHKWSLSLLFVCVKEEKKKHLRPENNI